MYVYLSISLSISLWYYTHTHIYSTIFIIIYIYLYMCIYGDSLVAHKVKNPPAIQETWIQSLGWENPLEEGMVTHSSILA